MKKIFYGGANELIMRTFLAIIIIGYFGTKIIYSLFFGLYPDKYYNRNNH